MSAVYFIVALYLNAQGEIMGRWNSTQTWESQESCLEARDFMKDKIIENGRSIHAVEVIAICDIQLGL